MLFNGFNGTPSHPSALTRHVAGVLPIPHQIQGNCSDRVLRRGLEFKIQVFTSTDSARGPDWIIAAKLQRDVAANKNRAAISDRREDGMPCQSIAAQR
jgi:hypothetical protein